MYLSLPLHSSVLSSSLQVPLLIKYLFPKGFCFGAPKTVDTALLPNVKVSTCEDNAPKSFHKYFRSPLPETFNFPGSII